jgi:endogenous inhibitor of DNA gyrase (YacG/DUF329 family)
MECPKCDTQMIEASFGPFVPLLNIVKKGDTFAERTGIGTVMRSSAIRPICCPNCGYIELYLEQPSRLST